MGRKMGVNSLQFRIYMIFFMLFAAVSIILLYNSFAAIDILRAEVCQTAQELLSVSERRLNDHFSRATAFLSSFTYQNVDIETLEQAQSNTTTYHVAMVRIMRQFTSSLPSYTTDSFFYFDPERDLYFANVNDIFSPVREAIVALSDLITGQNAGKWFTLRAGADDYLIRVVRVSHSYVGTWANVKSALQQVQADEFAGNEIYLLNKDGSFLSSQAPLSALNIPSSPSKGGFSFVDIGHQRFLAVTQKASFGDFYLAALMPDAAISASLSRLMWVIFGVSGLAFVLFLLVAALLHTWIARPIAQLTAAIRALQSGDFNTSLPEKTYDEFREVNNAFNTATEEIRWLKIAMYEEKILKQQVKMQYLQLQVAPHFLINCLNTIYQLTDAHQHELTKEMLRTLSHHLRYTLSSNKTVSLREELRHVRNYVELSAIRYPNSIVLIEDYDFTTLEAVAIPLLALNFVENTIKYEAAVGKTLEIHVSTEMLSHADPPSVHLRIWDTGGGFSAGILADLQDIPSYIQKYQKQHIGISNVFQRAAIVFEDCRFAFCNRPAAGAQIDMVIPYFHFESKEETL